MTNFLTYWIQRGMETEKQREEEIQAHVEEVVAGRKRMLARWDQSLRAPGYWNTRNFNYVNKTRHAEASSSPINAYDIALDDIRAGRETSK